MRAKDWLMRAKEEKFAIGAFNVGNLEIFKAVVQAAGSKKSPIIIESSPGETKWMEAENVVDIARNFQDEYGVPILVNLDHAETLEQCQEGIEAGYDLIHCDASKLQHEENVALTKKVAELAHAKGLTCEGELDHIGGSSTIHQGAASEEAGKVIKTDPQRAKKFVEETGIDIFAAFVGNIHGLYLGGEKHIDPNLVREIADATGVFLSLHGSSGIPDDQIKAAIQNGIVKINLNTEMRQAFIKGLDKAIHKNPEEYAIYKILPETMKELRELVEYKINLFGSAGKV